ncbi:hypothetical protein HYS91_04100 [Candidatus Daviesbacteria bacterium]|nr:hypothetical protein [Candidatus Daviesbacteria bacterium]
MSDLLFEIKFRSDYRHPRTPEDNVWLEKVNNQLKRGRTYTYSSPTERTADQGAMVAAAKAMMLHRRELKIPEWAATDARRLLVADYGITGAIPQGGVGSIIFDEELGRCVDLEHKGISIQGTVEEYYSRNWDNDLAKFQPPKLKGKRHIRLGDFIDIIQAAIIYQYSNGQEESAKIEEICMQPLLLAGLDVEKVPLIFGFVRELKTWQAIASSTEVVIPQTRPLSMLRVENFILAKRVS